MLIAIAGQAHAGFLGDAMTPTYQYPALGTVYPASSWSPASFIVGAGQETDGNIEGVTDLLVDFTDTTLTITLRTVLAAPTWNSASFNGTVYTAALPLDIAGATVDAATTMAGFDGSRVSFTSNEIDVDWNGLSYVDGTVVKVDFSFLPTDGGSDSVVEPATLAMFGAALAGLAVARRRRPTATAWK